MEILSKDRTLTVLSLVWLALCTGLVYKHPELCLVFLSFISCFAIACVLHPYRQEGVRVKIGIVSCVVSLGLLHLSTLARLSPESLPLALAVGTLAFDHWYAALCRSTKPLVVAAEDAVTLTVQLTALVWMVSHNRSQEEDALPFLHPWYRTALSTWLIYRMGRLALQRNSVPLSIGTTKKSSSVDESTTTPADTQQHPTIFKSTATSGNPCDGIAPSSLVWTIRGEQYDMSDYVRHHPGGKEAILLGHGRDCTALFDSYHPFTEQHEKILARYRISSKKRSNRESKDVFYDILRQRVAATLREQGLDPKQDRAASRTRVCYYTLLILGLGLAGKAHIQGNILGSIAMALMGWWIGALGHDAGHFAASRTPWVNEWGVWAMSFLCNPILWQHQHTYAHHSHTNSFEDDPDLHHFITFLRVHRRFQHKRLYKNQTNWLYVAFAYCFVCFGTCFWIPLYVIRDGSLYGVVEWTDRRRPLRALGMWAHLLGYTGFIMILPYFVHDSWWSAWVAVTAHVSTSGIMFALFSQINHLTEATLETNDHHHSNPMLKDSWAVQQIETANNFCPQSQFWHLVSNGLNLQIEHHLFPGLNHCHLPLIQKTVQGTCSEYGVRYKCYNSWNELMKATLDWLDHLAESNRIDTTPS